MNTTSKTDLETYLHTSRTTRRRVLGVGLVGLVLGGATSLASSAIGLLLMFSAALTVTIGVYITTLRIHEWEEQLRRHS